MGDVCSGLEFPSPLSRHTTTLIHPRPLTGPQNGQEILVADAELSSLTRRQPLELSMPQLLGSDRLTTQSAAWNENLFFPPSSKSVAVSFQAKRELGLPENGVILL